MSAREIVVAWAWTDGTRCVLCDSGNELELRVMRDDETFIREPVTDLLDALNTTAPGLEVALTDCLVRQSGGDACG